MGQGPARGSRRDGGASRAGRRGGGRARRPVRSRCRAWPRSATAPPCGACLPQAEAVFRRAAGIARQDEKPYRLTVVIGGLAARTWRSRAESPRPSRCSRRRSPRTPPTATASWSSSRPACGGRPGSSPRRWPRRARPPPGRRVRQRGGARSGWRAAPWPPSRPVTWSGRAAAGAGAAPARRRDWSYFLQFAR